jgi:hypothetical protein
MKQWDKWNCLWMAMATAQLVEMGIDGSPKYEKKYLS